MKQRININLIPSGVVQVIHLSQNDYLNGELEFHVYHGSSVVGEEIINALIKGIKTDNNVFIYNATQISGNVVTFDVKEQMTAASGKVYCKLRIQTADGAKHSKAFILDCEADPTTGGTASESDIEALEELIESIEGDIVDAKTAADEAADYAEQAKSTVVDVRSDITNIQQDVSSIQQNVSSIQNDVTETKNDVSGLQTNLNSEISNRTTQDAVLSARMDPFTKLPDGSLSTTADAELVDIRVMANGKTASTAGDAVREQITEIKSDLSEIEDAAFDEISSPEDITSSLETIGSGYYNNPTVMKKNDWKSNDDVTTFKYRGKAGETLQVTGYDYYAAKLYFLYDYNSDTVLEIYPTENGRSYRETTVTLPQDVDVYFATWNSKISDFSVIIDGVRLDRKFLVQEDLENYLTNSDLLLIKGSRQIIVEIEPEETGKYINTSGKAQEYSSFPTCAYAVVPEVHKGDKYVIKCKCGLSVRAYVVTSILGTVTQIQSEETWQTVHDYDLVVTIGDDSDGGTLYINTLNYESILGVKKELKVYKVTGDSIYPHNVGVEHLDDTANPLYGKTALFFGDSICHGTSVGQSSPFYGYGWAGRIGNKNAMDWHNLGISGRTVLYNSTGESNDVVVAYDTYKTTDYVILEACLNDGFQAVTKGEISESYTATFDNTASYCQAFEYMIQTCIKQWPTAKIGVIIPQKVTSQRIPPYQELAREICKKWSIPVCDLFYNSGLTVQITEQASIMFSDAETHLTDAGYDMITPKIEAWMKTL